MERTKKESFMTFMLAVIALGLLLAYVSISGLVDMAKEKEFYRQKIEHAIRQLPGTYITTVHAAEKVDNVLVYTNDQTFIYGEPDLLSEWVAEVPVHISLLTRPVNDTWSYVAYGEVEGFIENSKIVATTPVAAVVDISDQTLTVYENGAVFIETPVVTGRAGRWDTGQGVFSVTQKCRNKALINNCRSDYWLRFNRGQGLHDALWRTEGEFGGETYLKNGSHGCVNTPYEAMESVYALMNENDTVIVQY